MRKHILAGLLIVSLLVLSVSVVRFVRGVPPAFEIDPQKTKGAPDAPVFLLLYSDFACPYCAKLGPVLDKTLASHPGSLKIVFKHFPLKMHPPALLAAEASECAARQGKFWVYHDILFAQNRIWYGAIEPRVLFVEYARRLGLNEKSFGECSASEEVKKAVDKDIAEARQFYLPGTPALVLNGKRQIFSLEPDKIESAVSAELKKRGGK